MKRIFSALIGFFFATSAFAQANIDDVFVMQAVGPYSYMNYVVNYNNGSCILALNATAKKPRCITIASSLNYDTSTDVLSANVANPQQSGVARSLNSVYQISSTKGTLVNYSVKIAYTAGLTAVQDGDVILEIASNAAFTANVQTISISGSSLKYALAVAIGSDNSQTGVVSGYVPANYYVRIRTVNNSGTVTFTYRAGQEVVL